MDSTNIYLELEKLIEEKGKDALADVDNAYATKKISTMDYHKLIALTKEE